MKRALLVLIIIILLSAGAAGAGIEVRNATIWNATIASGPSPIIPQRIVVEHSNIIYELNLTDTSLALKANASSVVPRILIDHANTLYNPYLSATPADFNPIVSQRIVITAANQLWNPELKLIGIAFVDIKDNFFTNGTITIPVNTQVTWINFGSATHTVTADDGSFNSGNLVNNQSFTRNFTNAGTYLYHCSIHPSMTGRVIVTQPLLLKGDLNNNGVSADAGDLVLMKRASIGEIIADSSYDLNNNGQFADAGDLVLMKRASIGEINL